MVAKEGAAHGVRANVICPGFVKTPLVEKQIPEQAQELHISEEDVIKKIMLKDTVDGEFTTTDDVAQTALFFRFLCFKCLNRTIFSRKSWVVYGLTMPRSQPKSKMYYQNIACCLQGGGSLGAYQVGILEALENEGYIPNWFVGTSIGAINSLLLLAILSKKEPPSSSNLGIK